jgi:hypothetical protein
MPAIVTAQANLIINATLAGTACQATTGIKMYLGSNAPTASVAMTLITGTGSTPIVVAWNAASGGSATNSGTPSWTNGSGSAWSIVGIELWDEGSPLRWWFGTWTGAVPTPITIGVSDVFAVSAAAVSVAIA